MNAQQEWELHKQILEFSKTIRDKDEASFIMLNMIAVTILNKNRKRRLLRVMVIEAEHFLKLLDDEEKQSLFN